MTSVNEFEAKGKMTRWLWKEKRKELRTNAFKITFRTSFVTRKMVTFKTEF